MIKTKSRLPETEVELALSEVWQQVLGKKKISVDDNFFELGGHSFLAVKVINRINTLGYTLKLQDIFLHQTIAELSGKINGQASELNHFDNNLQTYYKHDNFIIPLQKEGELPPVFVVHSLWIYVQLAKYLGKNQPFYCLEGAKLNNLEDIAAFYIAKIKNIQPHGPYYLGGFCGNGFIALQMARQLVAEGEEVGALFLFETYSPLGTIPRLSFKYMKLSLDKLINFPSLNRRRFLKDELRQASKKTLQVVIKFITKLSLVKTFAGKIVLIKSAATTINYSGKVVLFKASAPEIWAKDDAKMGWSNFFDGELDSYTIEGSHTDMFKSPNVLQVAKIIRQVINNTKKGLSLSRKYA